MDPVEVARRNPEVMLASWCGKRVRKDRIAARPGWAATDAVRHGHIYEIKSAFILQPGPAALTEGVRHLHALLARAVGVEPPPALLPTAPLDPPWRPASAGERAR